MKLQLGKRGKWGKYVSDPKAVNELFTVNMREIPRERSKQTLKLYGEVLEKHFSFFSALF